VLGDSHGDEMVTFEGTKIRAIQIRGCCAAKKFHFHTISNRNPLDAELPSASTTGGVSLSNKFKL